MQFMRIVRWLEAVSGLMAGVLGLFFARYLFMALRAPWFNPSEAIAPLSLVLVDFIFLIVGITGAFLHGWSDRRVGRKLLWAGAIPLMVLTVLGIGPFIDISLFLAALMLLVAVALSMFESPLPAPHAKRHSVLIVFTRLAQPRGADSLRVDGIVRGSLSAAT